MQIIHLANTLCSGDGIPDGAEVDSGLDPTVNVDPTSDSDGDGLSDLDEATVYFTNASNPDTDGDGVDDFLEARHFKSNSHSADSDNDQMPDYTEAFYGFNLTDPSDAEEDADGDGYSNVVEIVAGTNPRNPFDHPFSSTIGNGNGNNGNSGNGNNGNGNGSGATGAETIGFGGNVMFYVMAAVGGIMLGAVTIMAVIHKKMKNRHAIVEITEAPEPVKRLSVGSQNEAPLVSLARRASSTAMSYERVRRAWDSFSRPASRVSSTHNREFDLNRGDSLFFYDV